MLAFPLTITYSDQHRQDTRRVRPVQEEIINYQSVRLFIP